MTTPDVILGGETFRLYDRYYRSTTRRAYLHRAIWELHFGPLPDDFHVHHKDEDSTNNEIGNLEAMPAEDHRRMHGITSEWHRSQAAREHLNNVRSLGHRWHKDPTNRASQSRKSKEWYDRQPWLDKTCAHCGKDFQAKRSVAKYCSHNCAVYGWTKGRKK